MILKSLFVAIISVSLVSTNDVSSNKTTDKDLGDWKKDPVCQAVYDGVLKGLEKDRVSLKIVDNVIGSSTTKAKRTDRMKRSFVIDCPLCEPTFEAFLAYQAKLSKRAKRGRTPKMNTGLSVEEVKSLSSENTMLRLKGLAPVVKRWTQAEFESNSKLSDKEVAKWKERVAKRFDEGKNHLIALTGKDKHYKDWSPYWGCAACNGSRDAAMSWKK